MSNTIDRDKVAARRLVNLITLPVALLFLGMRATNEQPLNVDPLTGKESYNIVFFGDITSWPDWIRGYFWPLDGLMAIVYVWVLFSLVILGLGSLRSTIDEDKGMPVLSVVKYVAGFVVGFGCFFGLMGTVMDGWFYGMVFFVAGPIFLAIVVGCLALGVAAMFGAGWCLRWLWTRFWEWSQNTWLGRVKTGISDYMAAKDIPVEAELEKTEEV